MLFIEPNLSLILLKDEENLKTIQVILRYESSPTFDKSFELDFDLKKEELKKDAEQLNDQIVMYPKR